MLYDGKVSIGCTSNIEAIIVIILKVRIAEKPEEVKSLLETGFEYVCQKDNLIFLRKAK
ncbi:MAG: hypothetical protein NWE84_07825 [Candidatus Bathyarchaeota archaeon]|nr:hypothetical protein [Candidatus Bathyarchaeota archaeon]